MMRMPAMHPMIIVGAGSFHTTKRNRCPHKEFTLWYFGQFYQKRENICNKNGNDGHYDGLSFADVVY